jgi:hypothetical protein
MKRVGVYVGVVAAVGLISGARGVGPEACAQGTTSTPRKEVSRPEQAFEPLFDGKTLKGWKQISGDPKKWAVENGCLVMLGEGGGWLGTDREYTDFELHLEFKLSPESNSGVYLRAPADASHISRTGMEIQLLDETHPRYKDIKDWQKTGALYHVAAPTPGHLKPTGEWNKLEIRLQLSRIVVRLNGVNVVEYRLNSQPELDAEHPGLKRRSGLIGLQSHNGRVEFRNIRIRGLGPISR